MIINPRLEIDIERFKENIQTVVGICQEKGIQVAGVTKGFCAMEELAQAYKDGGCQYIADSRILNLKKIHHIDLPKMLIRIPMLSQAEEVVQYADISLNSELTTMRALNEAAKKQDRTHGVILMVDLGDLREGYQDEYQLFEDLDTIYQELDHLQIKGIGANLTCFGGVLPDTYNMMRLVTVANYLRNTYDLNIPIVSGGNSSTLTLLLEGHDLPGVNQLRLGEALLFGTEASYGKRIPHTHDDVFKLVAEVVEVKEKPTVPKGETATNAFGETMEFEDQGNRIKAICAIGEQDVHYEAIQPIQDHVKIIGASSDHLILDVDDLTQDLKVGDEVAFSLHYMALLSLMTSEYVRKVIV